MLKLLQYLKHFKLQITIGPLFKLLEAIFELIVPLVMAKIIDVGIKNGDLHYIMVHGAIMAALGASGLCCALICQYSAARASQGFGTMVRNDLFRHINTLSYAELDRLGTSSLVNRITNDVNQLEVAVAMLIRLVIRAPFLVIGAIFLSITLDARLSAIFLISAPLVALILYFVMTRSIPYYRAIQHMLDRVGGLTRQSLEGARVIRAFSRQEQSQRQFEEAADDLKNSAIKVSKIASLLNPLTFLVMNSSILALLWFGGIRVNSGNLTQGQIIALVNYMTQIALALVVVANLVIIFTKASACAARINEVFATRTSIEEKNTHYLAVSSSLDLQNDSAPSVSEQEPTTSAVPKIQFSEVSFRYSSGREVLSQINLSVYKGETIGIIGGTGSGKSTLISLIPRFYDATSGELLVDGVDVKEYSFAQLRSQIGIAAQKSVLFSATLAENLRWGAPDATDEEIRRALSIAQASEFVDLLPDGLNTMIQQGGKNLSGGQKQRLTIARALIGNPSILILDDSASALDFATDAALRTAIRKFSEHMTVLMVSQRANTVREADRILVLDDGKVVGLGTHDQLLSYCGIYREIFTSQMHSNTDEVVKEAKSK